MNLLDPLVVNLEVRESNERFIAIPKSDPRLVVDETADLGYVNEFVARQTVVGKLIEVSRLLPEGISLSVKETYRPLSFQEFIFNRRAKRLGNMAVHSNKSESEIYEITAQFIAPPEVAGHPTGGAVDVSLIDADGNELDMGCNYDEDEETSSGRCFSFSSKISAVAVRNRQLLFGYMEQSGFVNYPYEWWHWSYGDKYWAAIKKRPNAIYGAVHRN